MRVQHPSLTLLTRYRTKFRGFLGEADLGHVAIGYSLCGSCRKRDPEAQQARELLTARYGSCCPEKCG